MSFKKSFLHNNYNVKTCNIIMKASADNAVSKLFKPQSPGGEKGGGVKNHYRNVHGKLFKYFLLTKPTICNVYYASNS